jgi:Zn finger protein HypA/HybF involved in hydrogenase expression
VTSVQFDGGGETVIRASAPVLCVIHNRIDPFTPDSGYYECLDCTHREATAERLTTCPECGSEVRNLAVPRE